MADAQSPLFRFQVWRANLPPALRLLLTINMAAYAAWVILRFIPSVSTFVVRYLALHPVIPGAFQKPWTLLTYGFLNLEASIWGLIGVIFAMLWLYWMGRQYEEFHGAYRLFGLYVLTTIGGAFGAIGFFMLSPLPDETLSQLALSGAWPAALGVLCCVATLHPNRGMGLFFLGVVPLKWIAIGFVVIDVLFGFNPTHVGGALMGFVFGYAQKQGIDLAAWAQPLFANARRGYGGYAPTSSRGSSVGARIRSWTSRDDDDEQGPRRERSTPKRKGGYADSSAVDSILDKILEKGYDSLTDEEKRILDEASRNA